MPTETIRVYRPNFLFGIGVLLLLLTILSFCCGGFYGAVAQGDKQSPVTQNAVEVSMLAFVIFGVSFIGSLATLIPGLLCYRIPPGYAQVKQNEFRSGWALGNLSLFNAVDTVPAIPIKTKVFETPEFEIYTPDDGGLAVKALIVYRPDISSYQTAQTFAQHTNIEQVLLARIKREVHNWIYQPSIGTLKKALASQASCENTIRLKLLSTSPEIYALTHGETPASVALQHGTPINELGIVLLEVNITEMRPFHIGTGQPDFGEEPLSDSEQLIARWFSVVSDLATLRNMRDKLRKTYPDDAEFQEMIEDLYDTARMRIKDQQ
jgi:hypothetical protein